MEKNYSCQRWLNTKLVSEATQGLHILTTNYSFKSENSCVFADIDINKIKTWWQLLMIYTFSVKKTIQFIFKPICHEKHAKNTAFFFSQQILDFSN